MNVKIWTKPETQDTIKQLHAAGYDVQKTNDGYKIYDDNGKVWTAEDKQPIFVAMNMGKTYLVRYSDELMRGADE